MSATVGATNAEWTGGNAGLGCQIQIARLRFPLGRRQPALQLAQLRGFDPGAKIFGCGVPRTLKLAQLRLHRPWEWGACWLVVTLWRELQLDRFWTERLATSRKGTRWEQVLLVLVAYRLIAPGSEWRLHRQWFERSGLADLLGADFGLAEIHELYACHDHLLAHKQALFDHLVVRWRDLFNASFEVLLYDLTSTYFEADPPFPEGDKRRFGYSRDKRSDCVQVIIALIVTPRRAAAGL